MGRLSDRKHSARRPGKHERARGKKNVRLESWHYVGGAGISHVKAGRKKFHRVNRYVDSVIEAHLAGDSTTPKDVKEIKRPLYKISFGP